MHRELGKARHVLKQKLVQLQRTSVFADEEN
jgi:hypothetical protein